MSHSHPVLSSSLLRRFVWSLCLLGSGLSLSTASSQTESQINPTGQTSQSIPFDQLGAEAQKKYSGDGISITPTANGALLRAAFQKLEGQATREGLWLTSTADEDAGKAERFRVLASGVSRVEGSVDTIIHLHATGSLQATTEVATFIRPGVVEEYRVSMDGVRQDFLILQRPAGEGSLSVSLEVTGATVEAATYGAKLTLSGSGRAIAYSRLRVTDATGKELTARLEVGASKSMCVVVEDAGATYPVRIDPTFSDADWVSLNAGVPGASAVVRAIAVDGSGNVYFGGAFTVVGTIAANGIAKWNGSTWSALGSGVSGGTGSTLAALLPTKGVNALAVSGSDLYVGGDFTTAGGIAANNIAKWNGSSWSALGTGMNSWVSALAVSGSDLYAGGWFTTAGGVTAGAVAKWNGISWSALGTGLTNPPIVRTLAVSGSDLYAGGEFTTIGGVAASCIAKWNGSSWSALSSGVTGGFQNAVHTLALSGSDLYAGGDFSTAGGVTVNNIAKWNGTAWSALGTGMNSFGRVYALAVSGSNLYAGGSFSFAGGTFTSGIAKWDGIAWSGLSSGLDYNSVFPSVYALAVSGTDIYTGGYFTSASGVAVSNITKWNGTAWNAVGAAGTGMNAQIKAMAVSGTNLYAGGDFTKAGGTTANYIVKWNGSTWSALGSGLNNSVNSLTVSGTDLYAGGYFTSAGGVSANHIAKWNGTAWSALGTGMNDFVNALAVNGTDLYAGGWFTTAGGVSANYIAKWNGTAWSPLGSGMGGSSPYVYALAANGTDLYAGGNFTTADGVAANRIAKWNGTAWSALGTGLNSSVSVLAVSGTDLYVGGGFATAGGISANRIAKWNGSAWSALGSGMSGSSPSVSALAISGTDLYAGGNFTTAGGVAANRIAKWNGSAWSALGSGLDNDVYALTVDASNHLFVGGNFGIAGTSVSPFIAEAYLNGHQEIAVEQPTLTDIVDGGGTSLIAAVSNFADYVFTIRNVGTLDLSLNGSPKVLVSGPDAALFTVTAQPTSPVAPGGSTTFTLRFAPNSTGVKNASLSIANDDDNENPFDIGLSGLGANPPTVTSPTSTNIVATSATLGGNVTADGGTIITERGVVYSVTTTNANPLINGSGVMKVSTTGTTGVFTKGTTDLIPNTGYSFKAYATNGAGTSYSSVGTFTTTAPSAGDLDPLNALISGSDINDGIHAITVQPDGKIIIAGQFSSVLGVSRRNIARLNADGTLDTGFDPKADNQVHSVVVQADGKILLGGYFTTLQPNGAVSPTSRNSIARLNADGTLDTGFDPKAVGGVNCVVVQVDGKILLGGFFTTLQPNGALSPTVRNRIARVNTDGTLDTGFDPNANNFVYSVAVQADGKILLGGGFTTFQPNGAVSATVRNYIARVNADGTLDTGFDPKTNNYVYSVAVQADGKILLAGLFTNLQPNGAVSATARNRIARVNADGTLDTGFDPKPNSQVFCVSVQVDGKILLGGFFTTLQPNGAVSTTARSNVARLNADGTLDPGFDPKVNDSVVSSVAVQADGKILLGGRFATLQPNGAATATSRSLFARLLNNGVTQTLSVPDATQVSWLRSGAGPEVSSVTFEQTINGGTTWTLLGSGTRVIGGWELAGLSLPAGGSIRARGRTSGGYNSGSSGLIEQVVSNTLTSEIAIEQPALTNIVDGGTKDFGAVNVGSTVDLVFTLKNTGNAYLSLSGTPKVAVNGTHASLFTVTAQPTSPVAPSDSTTFTVRFAPTSTGAKTAALSIANDDADENPFDIQLTGTGLGAGPLSGIDNFNDNSKDPTTWAAVDVTSGGASLVEANGRLEYRVTTPDAIDDSALRPWALNIARNTDAFDVILDVFNNVNPAGVANASIGLTVTSLENSQDSIFVELYRSGPGGDGKGFLAALSSNVYGGNEVPPFTMPTSHPAVISGSVRLSYNPTTKVFTAYYDATGSGDGFQWLPYGTFGVGDAPGNGATRNSPWQLSGNKGFIVSISGYSEALVVGSGSVYADNFSATTTGFAPEIVVEEPVNTSISTGATVNFGTTQIGSGINRVFTVKNTGTASLTGLAASITSGSSYYNVTSAPATTVAPGGSTTLTVRLGGSTDSAPANGSLSLASTDSDENPFIVNLTGAIVTPPIVTSNAATSVTHVSAALNGFVNSFTTSSTVTFDYGLTTSYDSFISATPSTVSFSSASVNAVITGLQPSTTYHYRVRASSGNGNPNGNDQTFTTRAIQPGDLDTLYPNVVGSYVTATGVQPDGKIIIGGNFTTVNGVSRSNIARLNADGSLDTGFDPKANGEVFGVTVQPDGKILLGGQFTTLQPNGAASATARQRIARVNSDGSLDNSFDPKANAEIDAVVLQADGKILLGGGFTTLQPNGAVSATARQYIARVNADGSLDTGFDPKANNWVDCLSVQADNKILIGGLFTTLQPNGAASATTRNRIARLNTDGSLDTGFDPQANGQVNGVIEQADGKVLLAGAFTTLQPNGAASPTTRNRVARVNADGSLDAGFDPKADNDIKSMAVQSDGKILLGGLFLTLQPNGAVSTTSRQRVARVNADGSLDVGFDPKANNTIWSVAVQADGKILLGGAFTTLQPNGAAGTTSRNSIAWLNNNAVMQILSVPDATQVLWQRGGGSPEVSLVTFEQSLNGGVNWTALGNGTRVGTSANWQLTGLSLPSSGYLRVRGRTTNGIRNAGSGLIEQVVSFGPPPSEIAIEQPVGTDIPDGGSKDFGTVVMGSQVSLDFTITNSGVGGLTGLLITKDGAHPGDFTISAPGSTTISPGGSTTFTVTFAPGAEEFRTCVLHCASNDADENPFDIRLTGTGSSPVPLAMAQQAYAKASNTGSEDYFGGKVAISGDTVVVGAFAEDSSTTGVNSTPDESATTAGAAYVFVRNGSVWTQQAYLKASNTGAGDSFGDAVAVSGDTIVVGAPTEDSNTTGVNSTPNDSGGAFFNSGAAYVYVRNGSTWTQQAYLKQSNTGSGDAFGRSVAVSGDTVVVGAEGEDSSTTGVNGTPNEGAFNSGAAYVFVRNGSDWQQQAFIKSSNPELNDNFGYSVAVSGDALVVGAYNEDSSSTGINSTPNELATDAGAAYVFARTATSWAQQAYLKASNTGAGDVFGYDVDISGRTIIVGALNEDSSATGVNGNQADNSAANSGAAYVYVENAGSWTQQSYLKAGNTGPDDHFGDSVGISGDTVVIGANGESSSTTGVNTTPNESAFASGAGYLFVRGGSTWTQRSYLKAGNTGSLDELHSVAVSGGTVVIGAWREDSSTTGVNSIPNESSLDAGAAYIFNSFNPVPEIAVERQDGTNLTSGVSSLSGGAASVGLSCSTNFTIRNVGGGDLTGIAITKDGAQASEFTLGVPGGTTLPSGGSMTFTVTFTPTTLGTRTAALHIASNDSDENPFDIQLTGTGITALNADNYANRLNLGNAATVKVTGTNLMATMEPGENTFGDLQGATVWAQWTSPNTGWVTVNTVDSPLDTLIGLYTGSGPTIGGLSLMGFNDESGRMTDLNYFGKHYGISRLVFQATAGTTYLISVGGWKHGIELERGTFELHIESEPTPAIRVTGVTFTPGSVDVTGATQTTTMQVSVDSDAPLFPGSYLNANIYRPDSANYQNTIFSYFLDTDRVTGTSTSGTYEKMISLPRYVAGGIWPVSVWTGNSDNAHWSIPGDDRQEDYYLIPAPINSSLAVINSGAIDTAAPTLVSVTGFPPVIDVTSGDVTFDVDITFTDGLSGFAASNIFALSSFNGYSGGLYSSSPGSIISGDEFSGVFRQTITVSQNTASGTYYPAISLNDAALNWKQYTDSNQSYSSYGRISSPGTDLTVQIIGEEPEIEVEAPSGGSLTDGGPGVDFGSSSVAATTASYDFSGSFTSAFSQYLNEGTGNAFQSGGVLRYHAAAGSGESNAAFIHRDFQPTYNQSWSAEATVSVPLSLDSTLPPGDPWIDNGLTVGFTDTDGRLFHVTVSLSLEPERKYMCFYSVTDTDGSTYELNTGTVVATTTDESGVVRLRFDAATKTLTAETDTHTIFRLDLGTAGWGMTDSDTFAIVASFSNSGCSIPESTPITIDDFHAAITVPTAEQTFTITNTGVGNLYGLQLTKDGLNDADFTLSDLSTTNLMTGQSTTFTVSFAPTGAGTRNAVLHLVSNDSDENPFDISLTGEGASMAPTVVTLPATGITRTTATLNGLINNNGTSATVSFDLGPDTNYGQTVSTTPSTVSSGTDTAVNAVLTGMTPGTTWHYRVRATNTVGTTLGADQTFTIPLFVPGAVDTAFQNPGLIGYVHALAMQPDGKILVGGGITTLGSGNMIYLARLLPNGSRENAFSVASSPDNEVYRIAVQPDGKIIISGSFLNVGGQSRTRLARLNSDGSLDTTFNAGAVPNQAISALVPLPDGKLLVGGYFDSFNSVGDSGLVRLNANGSVDTSFTASVGGDVYTVVRQSDGKILIGGDFTTVNGQSRSRIARLNSDGTLENTTTFDVGTGASSFVSCMVVQSDGKIIITGGFSSINGVPCPRIARLNANGSMESSATFNVGNGPSGLGLSGIESMALQADGKIIIGGGFYAVNGQGRNGIARLNSDGSLESLAMFDAGTGVQTPISSVTSVVTQADGNILIGGSFQIVNDVPRDGVARLIGTPSTQSLLVPDATQVQWLRGGGAPEVSSVTFEFSNNGSIWTPLGAGIRIPSGWQLTGLSLPVGGFMRAQAQVASGSRNGSSGLVRTQIFFGSTDVPEITVFNGASTAPADERLDNTGTFNFGPQLLGATVTRTFTIRNANLGVLSGIGVSLGGTGQFSATAPGAAILATGATTTFTVTFSPTMEGVQSRTVLIASNDADENPFEIQITGEGQIPPSITTQPVSRLIGLGTASSLSVSATGSSLQYQWLRNGRVVSGATAATFSIPSASLGLVGEWGVRVSNGVGTVTSQAVNLGVVDLSTRSVNLTEGDTLNLFVAAGAPGGSYRWMRGGVAIPRGINPETQLTIVGIQSDLAGAYTCQVTMPDPQNPGTPFVLQSGAITVHVGAGAGPAASNPKSQKPVLLPFTPSTWIVGGAVRDVIPALNAPTRFAVSGLPAGVKLNVLTGEITGRPTVSIQVPTHYPLTITASNAAGSSANLKTDVIVQPLPGYTTGNFHGIIERQAALNAGHGGRISLTIAATGSLTGKITLGAASNSFTGQLATTQIGQDVTAEIRITRAKPLAALNITFTIQRLTGELTGQVWEQAGTVAVLSAWRQAEDAAAHVDRFEIALTPAGAAVGDAAYPQTTGALHLSISRNGVPTWSGRLADSTTITGSSSLGRLRAIPLHHFNATTRSSLQGWLQLSPSSDAVDGSLDWLRLFTQTTAPSFPLHELEAAGTRSGTVP